MVIILGLSGSLTKCRSRMKKKPASKNLERLSFEPSLLVPDPASAALTVALRMAARA